MFIMKHIGFVEKLFIPLDISQSLIEVNQKGAATHSSSLVVMLAMLCWLFVLFAFPNPMERNETKQTFETKQNVRGVFPGAITRHCRVVPCVELKRINRSIDPSTVWIPEETDLPCYTMFVCYAALVEWGAERQKRKPFLFTMVGMEWNETNE